MKIDAGKSLRMAMGGHSLTLTDMAKDFGVHANQIGRWRKSSDMRILLAKKMADYFGMSLIEFIELGVSNEDRSNKAAV